MAALKLAKSRERPWWTRIRGIRGIHDQRFIGHERETALEYVCKYPPSHTPDRAAAPCLSRRQTRRHSINSSSRLTTTDASFLWSRLRSLRPTTKAGGVR